MGRRSDADEPTLAEAWNMLGERLGLEVVADNDRSIRASGTVRGRAVHVEISAGKGAGRREFMRFFAGLNTISSRNQREKWHTVLSVGCANPTGATGTVSSAVDLNDPNWSPGAYDPRNGRKVICDPPQLSARVLTPATHELLMSIMSDIQIDVLPTEVRLDVTSTARPGKGAQYVAGSPIHHYQGSPPPWPERALAGPPWWIDLLCDLADTLDA